MRVALHFAGQRVVQGYRLSASPSSSMISPGEAHDRFLVEVVGPSLCSADSTEPFLGEELVLCYRVF